MRRIFVILNKRAGTLLDMDPAAAREAVRSALGGRAETVDVVLASGKRICRAIDRAIEADYDTIVVGGGDGSVSYAVGRLAGTDRILGVLPLGTLNLLARDLGLVPSDLDGALAALAQAVPQTIDVGLINGRAFHTISGLGFFSEMARAREETRDLPGRLLRVGVAFLRAVLRTGGFTIDIEIDGERRQIHTYAVLVTVNRFGGTDWRRETLTGGALEVHIAEEEGALVRLKAAGDLITGAWRENPRIHSYTAREVTIASRRRHAWVATDGELKRERAPLQFAVRPMALNILMPRRAAPGE
jgi:diacylglycerol kinase family enzyme